MKKAILVSLSIVAAAAVGVGLWFWLGAMNQNSTSGTPTTQQSDNSASPDTSNQGTDMTGEKDVNVTIRDFAYSPSRIIIKKGTRVTWTNQDTVEHTVTASNASDTGGFPIDEVLFGKNATYSVVFNETGTFGYFCIPHTFMRGTVEVVE